MKILRNKWIVLIGCCLLLAGCKPPGKVTDPSDPRFDPMQFRFEDYDQFEGLQEAAEKMFPAGTSRSYVEDILVKKLGAAVYPKLPPEGNRYVYEYENWKIKLWQGFHSGIPAYRLHVFYDEKDQIVKVCAHSRQCRMVSDSMEGVNHD